MNVGVCLQMRNDLNELRRFVHGEQRFDDLRNARVTWPWAWAAKKLSKTEMLVLQHRLRNAFGNIEELKSVAGRLLDVVGDRGDLFIKTKLERELTLLGEHVESTRAMRSALSKLQGMR
jgi:geranylgeranyl pyrophosphate synthase